MGLLLLVGGFSFAAMLVWLATAKQREEAAAEQIAIQTKTAAWKATRAKAEADRDAFFASQQEFPRQSDGRSPNRLVAKLMMGEAGIRLVQFHLDGGFTVVADDVISPARILSVDISSPLVKDAYIRTEYVPKKKSALGRAAIGGALLGPAGAVVGAISAVGGLEEKSILEERMVPGRPRLTIITSDPASPLLEIELDEKDTTMQWLASIRAAAGIRQ